ncbi:MAG: [acyl-carrier-protein] S-malonyltransferase [Gammaproteobacteria bacterium 39-13]|nr:ACP S-malonyltransferase [Gammaproteobacteria bacterium]OJV91835.1 MAG: [acyl-carrier-protein] S-malonyltransferase [Gammaproteobacteria bacterium 39-13]
MTTQNKPLAFVFPGQGSQHVGMLKEIAQKFPLIQEVFSQSKNATGKDLWELAQFGPEASLNDTVNTQPALLTAGVALWQVWRQQGGAKPQLLAGHSLGEYTALVCANALTLEDAAKLVTLRGKLMQEAVPQGVGAMAAVLGLEDAVLQAVCEEAAQNEVVAPVNFNSIGQTVIAGHIGAVERASALAKAKGAKRVLMLPVSVPSHCELMKPAALALEKALTHVKISIPQIPVIHNVDVEMSQHPDDIREKLVQQLYRPVRWVETVQRLVGEGIQFVIECGPGKVLTGLIKRIDPVVKPMGIETPAEVETALTTVG